MRFSHCAQGSWLSTASQCFYVLSTLLWHSILMKNIGWFCIQKFRSNNFFPSFCFKKCGKKIFRLHLLRHFSTARRSYCKQVCGKMHSISSDCDLFIVVMNSLVAHLHCNAPSSSFTFVKFATHLSRWWMSESCSCARNPEHHWHCSLMVDGLAIYYINTMSKPGCFSNINRILFSKKYTLLYFESKWNQHTFWIILWTE